MEAFLSKEQDILTISECDLQIIILLEKIHMSGLGGDKCPPTFEMRNSVCLIIPRP